jgi:hypothetical protein
LIDLYLLIKKAPGIRSFFKNVFSIGCNADDEIQHDQKNEHSIHHQIYANVGLILLVKLFYPLKHGLNFKELAINFGRKVTIWHLIRVSESADGR